MAADLAEVMRLAKDMVVNEIMGFEDAADANGVDESDLRKEVFDEIVYRRMEEKSSQDYIRSNVACRILGIHHTSLLSAVNRAVEGLDIHAKRGRPFSLSPNSKKSLKQSELCSVSRAVGVNAVTLDDLSKAIDDQRRKSKGFNSSAEMKPLCKKTLKELQKDILPEICKKPHQKNRRRVEAANDGINFVSQSATNIMHFQPHDLIYDHILG